MKYELDAKFTLTKPFLITQLNLMSYVILQILHTLSFSYSWCIRKQLRVGVYYLIVSVFENKEKMVLVMEIAAGGELYDYLSERKTLEEKEARRVFRQIATAVFYCHKVGFYCLLQPIH